MGHLLKDVDDLGRVDTYSWDTQRELRRSCSSCSKQGQLRDPVPQGHIHLGFENLQAWRLTNLYGAFFIRKVSQVVCGETGFKVAVTAVDKYWVISHLRGLQVLSSWLILWSCPQNKRQKDHIIVPSYYEMSNTSTKEKLHLAPNSAPHWVNHLVCSVWNQQILRFYFLENNN